MHGITVKLHKLLNNSYTGKTYDKATDSIYIIIINC